MRLGIHMRRVNMTDDELWHAISQNTGALSALLHRQLEMDDADPGVTHPRMKADLSTMAIPIRTMAYSTSMRCRLSVQVTPTAT